MCSLGFRITDNGRSKKNNNSVTEHRQSHLESAGSAFLSKSLHSVGASVITIGMHHI
jgi:hypothetical protein